MAELVKLVWRRAPISVLTLASAALSYAVSRAMEDYVLFRTLDPGKLGQTDFKTWLVHTFLLRPIGISSKAAQDPAYLPLDDQEWEAVLQKVKQQNNSNSQDAVSVKGLKNLPKRVGERPFVYGVVPQRQLKAFNLPFSEEQKLILNHIQRLINAVPHALELGQSMYDKARWPAIFVRQLPEAQLAQLSESQNKLLARPTKLARTYLSTAPAPQLDFSKQPIAHDPAKHELLHMQLSEGSLHVTLSPQDARLVVARGWGELHRLAGIGYRGAYLPPYWLPAWLGNSAKRRWSYQQKASGVDQRATSPSSSTSLFNLDGYHLPPPTYLLVYAPRTEDEVKWVKRIMHRSVEWAIGRPIAQTEGV